MSDGNTVDVEHTDGFYDKTVSLGGLEGYKQENGQRETTKQCRGNIDDDKDNYYCIWQLYWFKQISNKVLIAGFPGLTRI